MIDVANVAHHPALEEIVDVLCTKTRQEDRGYFRTLVAYYFGSMAACMRATTVTLDRGEIPVNIYALNLATSGFGKGLAVNVLEGEFFAGFKSRFEEDTFPMLSEQNLWVLANKRAARKGTDQQAEFDKARGEFESKGHYVFSFDSGTGPAVKQMREKLLMSVAGSINLQVDEVGSNIKEANEALTPFLELYDQGLIKMKLTKHTPDNKRTQEISGKTPTNLLLFGTPARLFDSGPSEAEFYSLMETGYARRCLFGWGVEVDRGNLTAEEIFDQLTAPNNSQVVTKWNHHFYQLADPSNFNWKMDVSKEVSIELIRYKDRCEKLANKFPEHDEIKRAELKHRYFKALKLAGAYAFVDRSTEVDISHLEAAVKLTEESGEAFQKILTRDTPYMRLARFIAGSTTEQTHADLHAALSFYPKGAANKADILQNAIGWGYKNHIIIKKTFIDGIEFFKGETLKETNLDEMSVSYSHDWAYHYRAEKVPFQHLHVLTQHAGYHWTNHAFEAGHRCEDKALPGFNMIVIEVDGDVTLDNAHQLMSDYKFMTYTTKRHTEEENRFRLILPINYHLEMDKDEYKEFMNGIFAWLPFKTDEGANQRSKKWASHDGGEFAYNMDGQVLDVLRFIPKTSKNESFIASNKPLASLDNLERWFAQRIADGNRNNQMIKYALTLVDAGWSLAEVHRQVHAFDKKLADPMGEAEIDSTIMKTVVRKYQRAA